MQSLVDTYFARVHEQQYSFFSEADFRQRFDSNNLPTHLLLAISSLAIRFMNHSYFSGRVHEASAAYSKQAWLLVLTEHLMVLNNITLQVIQTISILAAVDFTGECFISLSKSELCISDSQKNCSAGRVSSGWLKVGLAARLAQGLDLMDEPPEYISKAEKEERRRTFWSIYLLDRLISCARARPPAISDDDCNVSLLLVDDFGTASQNGATHILRPLLGWETKMTQPPEGFTLAILMTMVLGRCTKFAYGRSDTENFPPYDPKSEYMAINSSLMLLESYLDIEKNPIAEVIREVRENDAAHDSKQIGRLIFARALFHLSHCLLNHPFLLRHRLRSFTNKVPRSFSLRALQISEDNAKKLTYLLSSASEGGVLVESSFYTYCVAVSGAIHTMADKAPQHEDSLGHYDASQYFQRSMDILSRLGHLWPMAKNIVSLSEAISQCLTVLFGLDKCLREMIKLQETRLRRFHDLFPSQLGLFDPSQLTSPIDPSFDELLWSVVDYNTLAGELPKWDVFPSMSALPSPSLWDMDIALPSVSQELDLGVGSMFPEPANMFAPNGVL